MTVADHFPEDVVARYDDSPHPEFDPAVIRSTVDVLAALAGVRPSPASAPSDGGDAAVLLDRQEVVRRIERGGRVVCSKRRTDSFGSFDWGCMG